MKNYLLYKEIKDNTYSIFEIYHKKALSELFINDLNMLELKILRLIERDSDIEIHDISLKLDISLSNLSNRFTSLEEKGYLIRKKSLLDNRKTDLVITSEGLKITSRYTQHMKSLAQHLRNSMSKFELLAFLGFIVKINNLELNKHNKTTTFKLLNDPKLLNEIIDSLQDYFINNDIKAPTIKGISLGYDQIYLLSEIYLNQIIYKKSLPKLADDLQISYQTLVSKTKKYLSLDLIFKDSEINHLFIFSNELIHILDNFIHTRIINYYQIMQHASEKEKTIILKVFEELRNFSISSISQKIH